MQTHAQNIRIEGTCNDSIFESMDLYANAMERNRTKQAVKLEKNGHQFGGEIPVASDGFYNLYGSSHVLPIYLPDASETQPIQLVFKDNCPTVMNLGNNNQALSEFNQFTYKIGRDFWTNCKSMSQEQIIASLKSCQTTADSLAACHNCTEPVKKFLHVWAYTTAMNLYDNVPYALGVKRNEVPSNIAQALPAPETVLDTPMAGYFSSTYIQILKSLPKGSLAQQLETLYNRYQCEQVRNYVAGMIAESFISSFKYDVNYEAGLADLTAAIQKYGLNKNLINQFKMRKASVKGSDFPSGINLVDANGNKVDFASFKGSYVYIDMWASWCAPCCAEVPHLQKLEKELQNKDVKFVSISIDKSAPAWKAKMKALNMHGTQLHNQDNGLAEALNVRGIPFFIIYDKEGKLYMYNAPRPSNPALKKILDELH